jgi:hypothetical protein
MKGEGDTIPGLSASQREAGCVGEPATAAIADAVRVEYGRR